MNNYDEALKLVHDSDDVYFYKGYVFSKLNQMAEAEEAYTQSINIRPQSDAYVNRGLVYDKQNKLDKALEDYNKAIELDPKYTLAYNNRGIVYYKQDKDDKALEDYNKAIELDPKYTRAYNNRGLVYEKQNKLDKALEDYNKAIELDPKYTDAYIGRGFVYGKLNRFDKASEAYSKAVELKTSNPVVYLNLSEALVISGGYKTALENIEKSSALMIELKDKTINLYLKCITQKILEMDPSSTELELNQLLKQRTEFSWSFREIETWAYSANIPDYTKNYIKEKTEMLKEYGQ